MSKKSNDVTIVGAGWLGMPLAQKLKGFGVDTRLSKRTAAGVTELIHSGWRAWQFELGQAPGATFELFDSSVLVLNIPSGRKALDGFEFSKKMIELIDSVMDLPISRILFISTTSVYGSANRIVMEDSEVNPDTDSGKAHEAIESHLIRHYPQSTTILRLAGLVGENRHPAKYLAGRKGLANPGQRVNLIHLHDVVCGICEILTKDIWGKVLHLSATEHPTREEYYQWAAEKLDLAMPEFVDNGKPGQGKVLDCSATLKELGLELRYPSPYDMIS